jgi:hypothetical protein
VNSVARIDRPNGITTMAGPGKNDHGNADERDRAPDDGNCDPLGEAVARVDGIRRLLSSRGSAC